MAFWQRELESFALVKWSDSLTPQTHRIRLHGASKLLNPFNWVPQDAWEDSICPFGCIIEQTHCSAIHHRATSSPSSSVAIPLGGVEPFEAASVGSMDDDKLNEKWRLWTSNFSHYSPVLRAATFISDWTTPKAYRWCTKEAQVSKAWSPLEPPDLARRNKQY